MPTQHFEIQTRHRSQMVEVTDHVRGLVKRAGATSDMVTVFIPHTTAGITINENADPDVVHDMLAQLEEMVPWSQPFYRHAEGNSAAHVKAAMMGSSVRVIIDGGQLKLGRWQGIWLCEFDGPRTREVWVQVDATSRPALPSP